MDVKVYLPRTVYEESLRRINRIFDEFENVFVAVSGGKDSTVTFELAYMVAKERNRLPLKVMWIDQEIEWQATVDNVRSIMERDGVEPMWFQIPMVLSNSTSVVDDFLHCWSEEDEYRWMRPRESYAYTENKYGTDRFKDLFTHIVAVEFEGQRVAGLGGVRAEESPARALGLTGQATYKDITWGKKFDEKQDQYMFYPIYDWSFSDIWKAIYDNGWTYNRVYDYQYQYGISQRDMRVSNLHHETAVIHLEYVQEVEPETYAKMTQRIQGIDTFGKLNLVHFIPRKLPYMFKDWKEYRDHLLENLVYHDYQREALRKIFTDYEDYWYLYGEKLYKVEVTMICTLDFENTKLVNFVISQKGNKKKAAAAKQAYFEKKAANGN